MNKSPIEWTNWTSNPIYATSKEDGKRGWFCEKVSPGCANCYSSTQNEQQLRGGTGFEFLPANREHHDFVLNFNELDLWLKPRFAGQKVFAFDMTDLFGEWVSDSWLNTIFAFIDATDATIQTLTKRPERQREFIKQRYKGGNVPENWWCGVTVENQRWADERIPILLDTPAAVRFVSAEPLLGPVSFMHMDAEGKADGMYWIDALTGRNTDMGRPCADVPHLDWIIIGGESGARHRSFDPDWARRILHETQAAKCATFIKQLGGARPGNRLEDLPEDLRVRQFPV